MYGTVDMYGVIDIGSNTMRLNIYKYEANELHLMLSKKITAGLAGFVNGDGCLNSKGIERAIASLNEFKDTLKNIDLKETFIFATASLRNINNSKEATDLIASSTGLDIQVISGEEEAILDYVGASAKIALDEGLLVDIGGGSTELVLYQEGKIHTAVSLPIGSLNLHNKYIEDFLPTRYEVQQIKQRVLKELDKLAAVEIPVNTKIICGVGGTVRATCKLKNRIYDLPHDNKTIVVEDIVKIVEYYFNNRHDFITHLIKETPDRLHTILPGMIVLDTVAKYFNSEIINVSEYGLREGYLIHKLNGKG